MQNSGMGHGHFSESTCDFECLNIVQSPLATFLFSIWGPTQCGISDRGPFWPPARLSDFAIKVHFFFLLLKSIV